MTTVPPLNTAAFSVSQSRLAARGSTQYNCSSLRRGGGPQTVPQHTTAHHSTPTAYAPMNNPSTNRRNPLSERDKPLTSWRRIDFCTTVVKELQQHRLLLLIYYYHPDNLRKKATSGLPTSWWGQSQRETEGHDGYKVS